MFSQTVQHYDTIYLAVKDYGAEADTLTTFIHQYRRATGTRLLDVACGTGLHLAYLKQYFPHSTELCGEACPHSSKAS